MIDQAFLDKLSSRLSDQEVILSDSSVVFDQHRFKKLLKEHSRLKKIREKVSVLLRLRKDVEDNQALVSSGDTEPELALLAQEELNAIQGRLPRLERELMIDFIPPDPNDSRNTIMEIRSGTGGVEAALFAGDLSRMYTRYAENRGWRADVIDARVSEQGGYKEIVFSIQGENVFCALQYECGTHRVQRIPLTESSGRIHTSAATVAVLPEAEPTDDIEIKSEDLRVDVYRASGAGGQHVNKTDSAVRITHLPTGIVVACQEERSQHKNRAKAMRVLRSRLLAEQQARDEEQTHKTRRSQIGTGDRSQRIRTYNFPQNRVTDHRINFTSHNLDKIMEGELDPVFKALRDHYVAMCLQNNPSVVSVQGMEL